MDDYAALLPNEIRLASPTNFEAFISRLEPLDQRIVIRAIRDLLQPFGLALLDEGWLKDLGADLYEFRVGPTRRKVLRRTIQNEADFFDSELLVRIFCTFVSETEIVILHFYDKTHDRTRSTQKSAIEAARNILDSTGGLS